MLIPALGKRAQKFLNKLPPKQFDQIDGKITALCDDPFPPDSSLLKGFRWYRVSIGEYRIIYNVNGDALDIPLIGKRNDAEVYKRLRCLDG